MTLDHLLPVLNIDLTDFMVYDIRDGWGIRFDFCKTTSVHYCLEGVGSLAIRGAAPIPLEPHTFLLLPPGVSYRIESASSKTIWLDHQTGVASRESISTLTVGEGQQGIVTACGKICVGLAGGSDLFTLLNEPLVVHFDDDDGLRNQFAMLLAEASRPEVGSRVLNEALLKQCLVIGLRRWIELNTASLPLLTSVADTRLIRALHAISEQPAAAYTVDSLATIATMSRSAFAAAFQRAYGQSPMSMVKFVRLRRASELLVTTALPVAEVAKRVGFYSRSSFSLAFSQIHGMDPSAFRRTFAANAKGKSKSINQECGSSSATLGPIDSRYETTDSGMLEAVSRKFTST